jgi:hypothetical protein
MLALVIMCSYDTGDACGCMAWDFIGNVQTAHNRVVGLMHDSE